MLKRIWDDFLDILFPPRGECPFCGLPTDEPLNCRDCSTLFQGYRKQEFCRKCGKILYRKNSGLLCHDCSRELPLFGFSRAVGIYEGIIKESLYNLKYTGRRSLAAPMGQLMARLVLDDGRYRSVDVIVPVPLAEGKLRQRRFNQSELLARELGKWLKVGVEEALIRIKDTPAQSKKGRRERLRNLRGAFAVAFGQDLTGKRILLVDDVLTTGSTLSECTKVLRDRGAADIMAITWAVGQDTYEGITDV